MSFNDEYLRLRKKRLEEQGSNKTQAQQIQTARDAILLDTLFPKAKSELYTSGDIAPVKPTTDTTEKKQTTTTDERKWFQGSSLFDDGWDFGDVAKTVTATGADLRTNLMAGVLGIGEAAVDAGAYIVGGIGGLFNKDFQNKTRDFIAKDLYDEEEIAKAIVRGTSPFAWFDESKVDEKNSVLGEKTDALAQSGGQLLGTIGLQAAGVPWFVTSGVTSFGSEAENAFNQGASYGQAGLSAAINAGVELATEKLFGGSGLGEKGLINLDGLTKGISNKVGKALLDFGIDMAAEGTEEVASQFASNFASALYKEENLQELLFSEEAFDSYLESYIGGAVLGGGANVGKVGNSIKTGRDYRTELTANEQKVFDKVYNDAIAKKEEGGKKLSKDEKAELYDEVMKSLQRGEVDVDTIEEALGESLGRLEYDTYKQTAAEKDALQKEYDEFRQMKKSDLTVEQDERYNEVKQKLTEMNNNKLLEHTKKQLSEAVQKGLTRTTKDGKIEVVDGYLAESYNEKARRNQAFEVDLTKYEGKTKEILENLVKKKQINNTRYSHEFWEYAAKAVAERGGNLTSATTDEILDMAEKKYGKEYVEKNFKGKIPNAFVLDDGTIAINVKSPQARSFLLGHEIWHTMEKAGNAEKLSKMLLEYDKSKTSEADQKSRQKNTEDLYDGIIGAEADKEYIADLVGKYIYNDADFIHHLSTKDQNIFQKVWDWVKHQCKLATAGSQEERDLLRIEREFEKAYRETAKATETAKAEGDTKYSLSDSDGKQLTKEQSDFFKDSKMRDENGNLKVMYHGSQDAGFHEFDTLFSDDDRSFFFVDRNDVAASYSGSSETYTAKTFRTAEDFNKFFAEIGQNEYEVKEEMYGDHKWFVLYEDGSEVASSETAKMLYDEFRDWTGLGEGQANYKVYLNLTNPLEVDGKGRPWNKIDAEFSQEIYDKYKSLTAEEKAALTDLAEWEDFRIFNSEIQEAQGNDLANAYAKMGEDVNIYDLFSVAADNFSEESMRENARRYLKTRDFAQRAKEQGYDGVIFKNIIDNGGYSNGDEGASTVAIAFDSNQIKSVANDKPTKNADIRYSLGDGREVEVVDGIAVSPDVATAMKSDEYAKPTDYMTKYSVSTTEAWAKNYLEQNHGADDLLVVEAIRGFTDKMVQDDAVRGYVPTGDYQYTKMGPLRSNVEYIRTFDMDTSCPRTFQFLNFRDAIQRKAGRYLTYNESINLLELMRAYGQQIPCCYCYVENKRVLLSASYNNFFGFRNAVMNAATDAEAEKVMYGYSEKKGLPDASKKAMARWRSDMSYNPSLTEVWTATNTARNSVLNYLDAQMESGSIDATTKESKLNQMVLNQFGVTDNSAITEIQSFVKDWAYDTLAKIPHVYNTDNDVSVSAVDERALALNHEALAYSKSASSAKNVENYVPYTDQLKNISKEDREYIMGMGGIRKHSSNDFRMDYVQDYFLFYADLAAGKWTGHTYTKSADFTKIFACTNDRINMSVAFYEDADGTLRENIDEGASWKDVRELRNAYKNVGSMAMVTSDNQLSYALNSDWIDMIIPFHASGLDKAVWYNLRMWNDYTTKQGERFYNADTIKQRLTDAGVDIPKGASSADVKALFEETFKIKHIYGKDGEVVKPHFFPGDTYVNGQLVPGHHNDVETYFRLCEEYGVHPRFYGIKVNDTNGNQIDVTEHPSYLKLIKETSRTDSAQEEIQFNFGNYDAFLKMTPFEYAMKRLQEEAKNGGFENTKADPYGVVDEFINEYLDKDRPLGYLTDRAKETRDILLEMSKENAAQQASIVEKEVNAFSLSKEGDVPTRLKGLAPLTDAYEAPMREQVATMAEGVAENATTTPTVSKMEQVEDYAPITEDEANALQSENIDSLTDADAPPETEAPYYGETEDIAPKDPFDNRDIKDVGNRKVKAYMYENPEVKPFFQKEANIMLGELRDTTKGERIYTEVEGGVPGEYGAESYGVWTGTSRQTSADIEYLLDTQGYSYAQIEKGLNAIIEDNGAENNAVSKRIEFLLNDRLMNGYQTMDGYDIPADQDYLNLLNEKQITEYSEEARKSFFDVADAYAPQEDVAPVKEQYEAIKPKREKSTEPRLKRIKAGETFDTAKKGRIEGQQTMFEEQAASAKEKPIKTIKDRLTHKLHASYGELSHNKRLRREAIEDFNNKIDALQLEYDNKKNHETKVANDILRRIERLKRLRDEVDADYTKRINDNRAKVEKYKAKVEEGYDETEGRAMRSDIHAQKMDEIKARFSENGLDLDETLKNAKNLSTLSTVDNTPQRVMEKALGYKEGQTLADATVNKVAQNETDGIKWLNSITSRKGNGGLLKQLSEKYHIKPGSKESAAAQMYAEGFYVNDNGDKIKYGDAELAKDFPDAETQNNIKGLVADTRIRQFYDDTLAQINESRTRNAYPEIKPLDNYYLHFRAMDDTFSRLGIPFNPNDIKAKDLPTDLNGVTADLKPGQPYFASAMHRRGNKTSYDLLGGIERYATGAKNQIYHIDDIQTLRALRNYIADTYGQGKGLDNLDSLSEEEAQERIDKVYGAHLSTFAKFLNEEANIIAGKTALIDRGVEGIIGRRGITFIDTINKQVGSNMVGLNLSSSLTNFLAGVQAIAKTNKLACVKSLAQTASSRFNSIFGKTDSFVESNPTIIRRGGADKFYRTPFQKVGDAGYVLMQAVDSVTTEFIVRAKYNEFIQKGMSEQDAIIESDKWTSRLMGDRSLGQMPQLYNSKMLGLITKFQLEVRNQLDSQFYDTIQEAKASNEHIKNESEKNAKTAAKVTATLFELAVLQHLFGKGFEAVAGYNPAFDIISVLATVFGFDDDEESEDTALDNIEQGFLELLEDLPYTSVLTGGRIPIASALPIEELIKGEDEYGNEKSRLETLGEAAPYYILPTGYGQIKKTVQGLSMFSDEHPVAGSYTDSGNLRFPVEDTFGNRVQAGLFGQWANKNAREYFDNDIAPLNEKQTQEYIDVEMPIQDYWDYRKGLSKYKTLGSKAAYIDSLDLTVDQKNILVNNIADRKEDIDMSNYGDFANFDEFDFYNKNPDLYTFLENNGFSYQDYASADEDGKRAYTWAYENPSKFHVAKAVSNDFLEYYGFKGEINDITADKDADGKSITGSRKEKVIEYVNSLDIDYGARLILFKNEYNADNTYNAEIVNYLNNREDISYEEMVAILRELGFTVNGNTVSWD